jgi:hypothetical protein
MTDEYTPSMKNFIRHKREIHDLTMHAVANALATVKRTTDLTDNSFSKAHIAAAVTFAVATVQARHLIDAANEDGCHLSIETAFEMVREQLGSDLAGMHKSIVKAGRR